MLSSFVIGFHTARIDNLLQTLRLTLEWHPEVCDKSQLVTVCQDTCDTLQLHVHEELTSLSSGFAESIHLNLNLACMHLPHVTNVGVECSKSDKLIILESDRVLPAGYFSATLSQLRDGVQITTKNMKKLAKTATDDEIRRGLYEYRDEYRTQGLDLGIKNMWSGNTALTKADYLRVGSMDEAYKGYGWADSDMNHTMAKAGIGCSFRQEVELHLWHPPSTYGEGDQKQMYLDNGLYFCKKWGLSVPDWLRKEIAMHKRVLL